VKYLDITTDFKTASDGAGILISIDIWRFGCFLSEHNGQFGLTFHWLMSKRNRLATGYRGRYRYIKLYKKPEKVEKPA